MSFLMRLSLLLLSTLLAACSYIPGTSIFQKREKDYLHAQSIPPLKIPPGFSSDAIQNYYPVAYRKYHNTSDINIAPPGLYN